MDVPRARRIDASGKTVLPGLIDAHVHLTIPPDGRDSTALVNHLHENLSGVLRSFLEAGVTTVRSTGDYWPWIRRVREPVAQGGLSGPRIVTAGPVLSAHLAIFAEAGVPVVLGFDWCGCYPNTREDPHPAIQAGAVTITEMRLLELGDLSRRDVIQAATANAARALEMEDRVGILEAGKLADLIVVDGNPLEDLSTLESVDGVVQGGEIVSGPAGR